MKTGNREIYSSSIRENIEDLNLPSRTGFENGYKTKIYDTTTVSNQNDIQNIRLVKSVFDQVVSYFSDHNSRDIMDAASNLVDISDLKTGDKIHIDNRLEIE